MRITKCDICKKTLNSGMEVIHIMRSGRDLEYVSLELCALCAKPVINFLRNKKLINIYDKKNGGK